MLFLYARHSWNPELDVPLAQYSHCFIPRKQMNIKCCLQPIWNAFAKRSRDKDVVKTAPGH